MTALRQAIQARGTSHWLWLAPALYFVLLALYWVGRFDGLWVDGDSATFARHIRAFVSHGRLVPQVAYAYPNGYLDQATSTFLVLLGGLDGAFLQQRLLPLLGVIIVPVAWLAFREFVNSDRWAAVCTFVLFLQADVLFVVLRSSHEKFTRTLLLLLIVLVVRLVAYHPTGRRLAVHAVLTCVVAYAMLSSNLLMTGSFMLALVLIYLGARFLVALRPHLQSVSSGLIRRIPYVVAAFLVTAYLFAYYVYPPAQHNVAIAREAWSSITALVADTAAGSGDGLFSAYAAIRLGWINVPTYLLLSAFSWFVVTAGAVAWLRYGVQWVIRRESPPSQAIWFLWLLFGAYSAQAVMAVISDASGTLTGNVQVRLLPTLLVMSIALVGSQLRQSRPTFSVRQIKSGALAAAAIVLSVLAMLKATNEPLLSNKWSFYRAPELAAVSWANEHLQDNEIWAEFDERLTAAFYSLRDPQNGITSVMTNRTRTLVVSDVTRLRSSRTGQAVPLPPDALQVYDNGLAQVYRLRPESPYHR